MASSADQHGGSSARGDLAAALLVGIFAASFQQLVSSDRITRAPRHALVRWLNAKQPLTTWRRHAQYPLGCWDCGPMWWSILAHLALRRSGRRAPLTNALIAAVASRAVARAFAEHVEWTDGFSLRQLADGTRLVTPRVGRDWPKGIDFPPKEATS